MAFRYHEFGQEVASNPRAAHKELVRLFRLHDCSTAQVALELGCNVVTLRRWVKRLVDGGLSDPGGGQRLLRGNRKSSAVR